MITAILHGSPRAAHALVEAGAAIDSLFAAAGLDRVAVLDDLLTRGAGIDARFRAGNTALHAAAAMGCAGAVAYLLERGADPTLRDQQWGNTPADTARYFGHADLAAQLEAAAIRAGAGVSI